MIQVAADAVLVVFLCAAAWWDARADRIPNELTVTGLAAAMVLRAPLGSDAITRGLAGFGIALLIAIVLYALRAIGGGDVKLLAGVGAFLGSGEIVGALGLIAVLGAAFALLTMLRRGMLPLLIWNTMDLVKSLVSLGQSGKPRRLDSPAALTVPYGVPIATGALIWWFGQGVRL
ncbi:MAG TPA: prepilin peptidase [Gemmatimonadales bacterium]|nr:prepilin peptidase [Gemmatimonadales bacterium]